MNKLDLSPKIGAWGIWDRDGLCWIGDDKGPQTYMDAVLNGQPMTGKTLARLAATVFNQRTGHAFRFQAKQYLAPADRLKDHIEVHKSAETALKELFELAGPGP